MNFKKRHLSRALVALGIAGAVVLAGCSSGGSDSGGAGASPSATASGMHAPGPVGERQDGGTPKDGGTLTFGTFNFPRSLDPTHTRASGAVGGTELAAIYDVLVRMDYTTGDFVPQLAEKLEHNAEFTQFTVTLRKGATFSDGTPLDSAAVKQSIQRYLDSKFDLAPTMSAILQGIATPDPQTVVFTLSSPWSQFPVLLTTGPGYIVAPSAVKGDSFTPIGAGPYTVSRFAQHEELVLEARDGYYGGRAHIDTLRFVPSSGAKSNLDALNASGVDMVYMLQDRQVIQQTIDQGYSGYLAEMGLGQNILINNKDPRPGSDARVRQAIAYGIDRDQYLQRVQGGLGDYNGEMLAPNSMWNVDVAGISYDPEKAKKLLAEAKADGYDGKIALETASDPFSMNAAQAIQASLNNIGFDCTLNVSPDPAAGAAKVFNERNFDISRQSLAMIDEAPYIRLQGSLGSDSGNNPGGYSDAQMDGLLSQLQAATTHDERDEILGKIQTRINETVPYAILGPMAAFTGWNNRVHGVQRTTANIWLFNDAWVS
ncbi:ABC transporter substrate-binding protein [Tomitella gaofuii]|uniref:ABC transporter substrate-binding protein n=1 Tax=Tomitella gaofuii TaxID=2760083 RepID=UPI0015F998F7|nr:ABC transporter substrate-binding protein [Tomitella gaofuii]